MDWKLEVVVIPVADVDRAKEFYAEKLGFVVDVDNRIGDDWRNVQLTPEGSACSLAIGTKLVPGLQLVVSDIEDAHEQLASRGVETSGVVHFDNGVQTPGRGEGPYNSFLFFKDPDGNNWAVQEK